MRARLWFLAALSSALGQVHAADGIVVIGHPNLPALDAPTLEKVYTGKVVEVNGVAVTAVNAQTGSESQFFIHRYLILTIKCELS